MMVVNLGMWEIPKYAHLMIDSHANPHLVTLVCYHHARDLCVVNGPLSSIIKGLAL